MYIVEKSEKIQSDNFNILGKALETNTFSQIMKESAQSEN